MAELVAKRYGAAIFELAKEEDAVEVLETEILAVRESFQDRELVDFLSHPKIALHEKIELLETSLTGRIGHDLLGLLILVVKKNRYDHIADILEEVVELIDVHHGRVKAYISSPDALSVENKSSIIHELAALTHKEILPIYEVDPSLIGGLVIRIGDRIVDNSIKGHLHSLSKQMLQTKI